MPDQTTISCKVDLDAGTVEIVAPQEHFSAAAKEAKSILALRPQTSPTLKSSDSEAPPKSSMAAPKPEDPQPKPKPPRASRASGGSSTRAGRIGSFSPVDFGFSEEQERKMHEFYQSKQPKTQHEKIAVAMVQGEQLTGKQSFNYNEIYSLMRLGGERSLAKALDVLLSSMKKENWIVAGADGFSLKFLARDHVEQMPKQVAQ